MERYKSYFRESKVDYTPLTQKEYDFIDKIVAKGEMDFHRDTPEGKMAKKLAKKGILKDKLYGKGDDLRKIYFLHPNAFWDEEEFTYGVKK